VPPRDDDQGLIINGGSDVTVQEPANSQILMAQRQWDQWNQAFTRVTFTSNTAGTSTAGNIWRFENPIDTRYSGTTSTSDTIFLGDTTTGNNIEIHGDLRIVPDNSVPWNPGVVLPYDVPSIPAELFQPGIRTPRLSPEQRERRQRANAAWLRAEQLLRKYLTREQRRELVHDGLFHVQSGDRRYRISKGRIGNVEWVDREGNVLQRYCCHVRDLVPTYDNLLAQMLLLIHDERRFIETANVHYRRDKIVHPFEQKKPGMFDSVMLWPQNNFVAA